MRIKNLRGDSVDELLQEIKEEFSEDVQLMGSRSVRRPGFWGWFRPRQVEITVAIPDRSELQQQNSRKMEPKCKSDAIRTSPKSSCHSGENQSKTIPCKAESPDASQREDKNKELPETGEMNHLLNQGVPKEWAYRLVRRLQTGDNGNPLRKQELWPRSTPIKVPTNEQGDCLVVALVGPTGSGKTTTCAKLAAMMSLREEMQVGLITLDTFRIGAVEQLRSYSRILKVPLEVVFEPDELQTAVKRLLHCRVIFVDTAGRSHRNKERVTELEKFLHQIELDETHLVLNVDTTEKKADSVFGVYRDIGFDRLLLTKIDESEAPGRAVALANRAGVPLSYISTGQNVPGDIGQAPEVLSELLLKEMV